MEIGIKEEELDYRRVSIVKYGKGRLDEAIKAASRYGDNRVCSVYPIDYRACSFTGHIFHV